MKKRPIPVLCAALLGAAMTVQAAEVAKTASAPTAGRVNPPTAGGAPAAGGNGGGLSTNGGNTGTQVAPKKPPKCPDPNSAACKAVQVPATQQ